MKKSQKVLSVALVFLFVAVVAVIGLGGYGLSHVAPPALAQSESVAVAEADQVTRTYDLEGFTRIAVAGNWHITLTRGDAWQVRVSYPQALEGRLQVAVDDGDRLDLDYTTRDRGFLGLGHSEPMTAEIVMPNLRAVVLAGTAVLDLAGFQGERLAMTVTGAAQVDGHDGRYAALALTVSGAGNVDLEGITVTDAHVDLAGAGDVTLTMDGGVLSGSISGAGKIAYFGTVREQRVNISGFGKVSHAN
jgi:Putative auto-transporter adhesin, head GIN domain